MNRKLPFILLVSALVMIGLQFGVNKVIVSQSNQTPLASSQSTEKKFIRTTPTPVLPNYDKPTCPKEKSECEFTSTNAKIIIKNTQRITGPLGTNPIQEIVVKNNTCEEFTIAVNTQEEAGTGIQIYYFDFIPNTNYFYYTTGGWEGVQTDIVDTCTGNSLLPTEKHIYSAAIPSSDFYYSSNYQHLIVHNTSTVYGNEHNGLYLITFSNPPSVTTLSESKSLTQDPYSEQSFDITNVELHDQKIAWEEESKYSKVHKSYSL